MSGFVLPAADAAFANLDGRLTRLVLDVKEFGGALGDGVNDDTSAIQATINALTNGGVVYFPVGYYKLTANLTALSNITFRGAGDNKSVVWQSSTTHDGISGVDLSYVSIEDMRIIGPNTGTGTGIKFTRSVAAATPYLNFKNVTVYQFGVDGIELSNPIVSTFERVNAVDNVAKGFNIHGVPSGAAGTSCSFTSCYANANGTDGWYIENMVYTFLGGCAADGNVTGYHFKSCQSLHAAGCGTEGNTSRAFWIEGGYGVTLTSPWVYDNRGVAIDVSGSANTVTLVGATDNTPGVGATNFIRVAAGSHVLMANCSNSSPNNIVVGTTAILVDATGGAQIPAYTVLGGGGESDADWFVFGGNLWVGTAGKGLRVKEGSNCKQGTATLVAGTVTVANTSVTANSRIFLTVQTAGGTQGFLRIAARTAGTSFTITSTNATETSTVAYQIFEPA